MADKKRVLVLCTGNSARSQMAEGLLRHEAGDHFEVFSAGTKPSVVRPEAISVMNEIGIDISGHRSKSVEEFSREQLDYLITVCDNANESCPVFPGTTKRLHWPFEDPAAVLGSEEERKAAFRKVRDQIHGRITVFLGGRVGHVCAGSWSAINAGLPGATAGVVAVTVGPSTPLILYTRTNGGAIFKSTDGAASWKPVGGVDDVKFLGIDPQNSSTLYAATGHGILKSTDGGENWNSVSTALTNTSVNSLAIDPVTPSTLYAVTISGVFKSANGGGSWSTLNAFPSAQAFAASLMIDPLTPSIIYAALWNGGIFKSEDGGESWKAMKSSPFSAGFSDYALSLAIDPLTPSTIYAGSFASFSLFASGNGGISKSMDGGQTWNTFNAGIPSGAFVSSLAIDPSTPSIIYARTNRGAILKSTDGGGSWNVNNNVPLSGNSVGSLAIDPSAPSTIYAGYFDFPAGGGGLFKSTDGGESWNAADAGLASFDVRVLAIDPVNAATVYTGGSGSVFKSVDRGASWTNLSTFRIAGQPFPPGLSPPPFADGPAMVRSLLIDFINPNILYVGTTRVGGCAFNDKVVFKSTDGGANWSDSVSLRWTPSVGQNFVRF